MSKSVSAILGKFGDNGAIRKDYRRNKQLYLMLFPVLLFYIIFCYWPMFGIVIAFKDYRLGIGIFEADWVGLEHFIKFFNGPYFGRTVLNTLILNIYSVVLCFPIPIILALLFNEVKNKKIKGAFQTFTYLPHFISVLIICGIIIDFTASDGIITSIARNFGYEGNVAMLLNDQYFRPIYVFSEIWQLTGWNSIIYLSAISGINPELYEAARIDGAGRWKQAMKITLPCLSTTIIILLILSMGRMMSVGFEKVFLLQKPATYSTSDVISTFVYRKGLIDAEYGYSTAVGLFNSTINFLLLILSNGISRRFKGDSLF